MFRMNVTMKHLSSFFKTILPSLLRFPALHLLTLVAAAVSMTASVQTFERTEFYATLSFCLLFGAVLAFAAQLLAEKFLRERIKTQLALQAACALCVIPLFIYYKNFEESRLAVTSIFLALLAMCPFLLRFSQNENEILPNIFTAFFAAFIITMCVGCALSIIHWTLSTLFFSENSFDIYEAIWSFSFYAVALNTFVAYSSKKRDQIKIPKLCKIVFLYTLLPLYALLLLVLYCYLAKSAITLSIPMRDANTFISIATALYVLFYFCISYYDCKATKIFYKFCPWILLPLVAVQILISIDRIRAHGISPNRYAVVMYTLFTCIALALSFYKKGKFMFFVCPTLAAILLFAGASPLNIQNVPLWSQTRIMEKILNERGLLLNGKVDAKKAAEILTNEEREVLSRAYGKIRAFNKRPKWFETVQDKTELRREKDFEKTFGFKTKEEKKLSYYFELDVPSSRKISVPPSSDFYVLKSERNDEGPEKRVVKFAGKTYDLAKDIRPLLKIKEKDVDKTTESDPIYIDAGDGYTIVLTYVSASASEGEDRFSYCSVKGFAVKAEKNASNY